MKENLFLSLYKNINKKLNPIMENHGPRVAFLAMKYGEMIGIEKDELLQLVLTSYIHDIGVQKNKEISTLLSYDTLNTEIHSAYGAAILKYFFTKANSDYILYHHVDYMHLKNLDIDESIKMFANIILICDRTDIIIKSNLAEHSNEEICAKIIRTNKMSAEARFDPVLVEKFNKLFGAPSIIQYFRDKSYLKYVDTYVNGLMFNNDIMITLFSNLIKTIEYIDPSIAGHSIITANLSSKIALLAGSTDYDAFLLKKAALLHDIGKAVLSNDKILNDVNDISPEVTKLSLELIDGIVEDQVNKIIQNHKTKIVHQKDYELNVVINTNILFVSNNLAKAFKPNIEDHFEEYIRISEDLIMSKSAMPKVSSVLKSNLKELYTLCKNEYEDSKQMHKIITDQYDNYLNLLNSVEE